LDYIETLPLSCSLKALFKRILCAGNLRGLCEFKRRYPKNFEAIKEAEQELVQNTQDNYFETLKWLYHGTAYCITSTSQALRFQHTTVMMWLYRKGFPLHHSCCSVVARQGNLDLLKWLVAHDCQWGVGTVISAIDYGHLEVAKWAITNGCFYISYHPLPNNISTRTWIKQGYPQ
jgi:hypothetical protein